MIELSEKQTIDQLAGRLAASYQQVEGRPIRDFVPLFVERQAKDELSKLCAADPPGRETVV